MREVKIHLEFFHDLIKGMETADTGIPTQVGRMQRVIQSVDLSSEGLYTPGRALDWVIDELPGLRRRLALAELVNSMLPQGMDVVTIDESQLPTQSPHEAEADARRAAELMTIYGSPMYEDSINEEGELPQEIVDLLKENAHDPYFAAELAEQTDPAVVASFLENLAKANNRFLQMEEDPPDSYAADYDTIVQGLGTSLGQATSNTGDLALDDDVRERWLTAMTTPTFAAEPGELATPGDDAAILTFLTTTGNWDPQFLQSAVERVYVQERHHEGGHEMWWTGTGPPMLPGFEDGPMDPMTQLLLGLRNHPGTVQALLDDDGLRPGRSTARRSAWTVSPGTWCAAAGRWTRARRWSERSPSPPTSAIRRPGRRSPGFWAGSSRTCRPTSPRTTRKRSAWTGTSRPTGPQSP
ncbi:hypothetical protein [Serinicoccus marinus]|uniref:hypothetical protein n=1 Tax=Serinicoccus marinus TaxID=247333 RepID=UPI00122E01EE|nr:hypothetical protein [Serinicoccus marinus]